MRVHLKTLGCRLNEAELERWSGDFQDRGHRLSLDGDSADLVVVNTCAVTGEAAHKSRKLIRRVRRDHPRAKLVVSGCYASLDPAEMARTLGVDLVVSNQDKDHLVEIAHKELDLNTMSEGATQPSECALFARDRQRAFVKIQDGCRYRCSFCIVTIARGEERSRPPGEIVAEVNGLVRRGIREVVLTGVHIGGYGRERDTDLYQLVRRLLDNTDIPRLRLGSVEPWDLPKHFWSLFENPRCMPHLHLPLQSGADSVLRRMARRCKTSDFTRLIHQARNQVPDFNVTTDVMVGFPGETEDEWRQTVNYIQATGFGHLHIFSYSPRTGTKAADMPNQIPPGVKRHRSREMQALGQRMKKSTLRSYLGREFSVLIEGKGKAVASGAKLWTGYTPNFLRVVLRSSSDHDLRNSIRRVKLERLDDSGEQVLGGCPRMGTVASGRGAETDFVLE
jgi:threonylcarbamoyladenosine tRNA methylthiotransferase MtaB